VALLSAFGWRNLGFIIGTALLIPLGLGLESIGPHGPDAGGGAMTAMLRFFLVFNVMEVIKGLIRGEVIFEGCDRLRATVRNRLCLPGIDGDLANLSPCGPQRATRLPGSEPSHWNRLHNTDVQSGDAS
jgi:hypothetical protein